MMNEERLISTAYDAFNKRDIDTALDLMDPNVDWPNGWEGGYLHGRKAVKEYWIRQWQEINPNVSVVALKKLGTNKFEVTVHQFVRDMSGNILINATIKHIYTIENGLIKRMEIEKPAAAGH